MAIAPGLTLLSGVRRLFGSFGQASVPDAQLLERFLKQRDQAAFELLMWRHGGLVLNLCRRVLHDEHLAEDAFQLTFVTLAQRAETIGKGESVASWLYKVAYRHALRVRSQAGQRAEREEPLGDLPLPGREPDPADAAAWRELRPLLDEEVNRLPEKYRTAFVLCYLQGLSNEEAARQLGCPKGTVDSRLARARERLRQRLAGRGLAMPILPFTVTLLRHAGETPLGTETVAASLSRALGPTTILKPTTSLAGGKLMAKIIAMALMALASTALAGVIGYNALGPGGFSSTPAPELQAPTMTPGGCGATPAGCGTGPTTCHPPETP